MPRSVLDKRPYLIGQAPSRLTSEMLDCRPFAGWSGAFLAALLGVHQNAFLKSVVAVNLINYFPGRNGKGDAFPVEEAAAKAKRLLIERLPGKTAILAGKAVAAAFGLGDMEFLEVRTVGSTRFFLLPHPSGINTWWNDGANRVAAIKVFRSFIKEGQSCQKKKP